MYDKSVDQELSPTLETRLIQKANYAVFHEQCPGGFPTALLDLSSKESSKFPVVFQKEAGYLDRMTIKFFALLTVALMGSVTASAQTTKRIPLPASQNPSGADLPFSAAVWAGDTLYVSGWLDPDLKTHTDTTSQTVGIIKDIQKLLESQKLTLSNVVMMRVYLGGDPAKGGKMDVAGARAGYSQFL